MGSDDGGPRASAGARVRRGGHGVWSPLLDACLAVIDRSPAPDRHAALYAGGSRAGRVVARLRAARQRARAPRLQLGTGMLRAFVRDVHVDVVHLRPARGQDPTATPSSDCPSDSEGESVRTRFVRAAVSRRDRERVGNRLPHCIALLLAEYCVRFSSPVASRSARQRLRTEEQRCCG